MTPYIDKQIQAFGIHEATELLDELIDKADRHNHEERNVRDVSLLSAKLFSLFWRRKKVL